MVKFIRLFNLSFDVCLSAKTAIMLAPNTIGYRRHARGAEVEVRTARFVFRNISKAGSAGNVSIRIVRAAGMCR
jgi:hypothetical protein